MTGDDEIMTGDPHWNDFPGVPLLNFFPPGWTSAGHSARMYWSHILMGSYSYTH